jgi:hypothetical protein
MTEAEAKTKICPFRLGKGGKCAASQCMAWRLTSPLLPGDGFCGLAGRPVEMTWWPGDDHCD